MAMQELQAARNHYGRFASAFQTLKIETPRAGTCARPNKAFDRSRTKALS
jgi:hypothetical protein